MGKALYRKYRSRSLSEVVGQEHITTTLSNALKNGKISHAYLLTGPRGVGKTSIARILAHEINGLPYSEDPHFDIIEIDAASNNGVEDVRDLRDKIMNAPASAKYKVFIIDEVHMLSKAAFNALLKTLEEPPEHAVFILATTESHKLPETIISRTQRYNFRPATVENVIKNLRSIAKKENIAIDDDALLTIAEYSEGSFRDSVSLLDQASTTSDSVTKSQVEQLIGRAPQEQIEQLYSAISAQQADVALQTSRRLLDQGYEPAGIAMQLSRRLRAEFMAGTHTTSTVSLLRDLLDVPASHNPQALLDIIIMKYTSTIPQETKTISVTQPPAADAGPPKKTAAPIVPQPAKPSTTPHHEAEQKEPKETSVEEVTQDDSQKATTGDDDPTTLWHNVLQDLKQTHNTLYGIARMARPKLENDTLTLELSFAFHQKRLSEPRTLATITQLVDAKRGQKTTVRSVTVSAQQAEKPTPETVSAISNIFGGAELLES